MRAYASNSEQAKQRFETWYRRQMKWWDKKANVYSEIEPWDPGTLPRLSIEAQMQSSGKTCTKWLISLQCDHLWKIKHTMSCVEKQLNGSYMTSPSTAPYSGKSTLYCQQAWHQDLNAGKAKSNPSIRMCRSAHNALSNAYWSIMMWFLLPTVKD